MSVKVFKILLFLKRRPDITVEAFRDYYENRHVPLALKHGSGMTRYMRRYVEPQPHAETGSGNDLAFDVITELWFEDEATFKGTLKHFATTLMPEAVIEDEKNLFDRSSIRIATVVECETTFKAATMNTSKEHGA